MQPVSFYGLGLLVEILNWPIISFYLAKQFLKREMQKDFDLHKQPV